MSIPAYAFKPLRALKQLRTASRLDLRPGDGLRAKVDLGEGLIVEARLFDISPTGAGIIVPLECVDRMNLGTNIELVISTPEQGNLRIVSTLKWKAEYGENQYKFGIQFHLPEPDELIWRRGTTVDVPEYTPLTGVIYKPYLFYERAPLRIEKISEKIWRVRIYDSEILAVPGLRYEINLSSTVDSSAPIVVKLMYLVEVGIGSILVDVVPESIPPEISEWMAQQLIFGADLTPATLREIGFDIKNLANGLKFRYIKSQEDYEAVLDLRFKAYKLAGKVTDGKTVKDMVAPLDPISRIIAAYHGDKIVGSVAVAFPKSEDTILDTERPFKNGYPRKVPPKTQMVEVARLCTDPEYRRGDLMVRILEHIYKALRCGNRAIVITSTDDKLWPLYKSIGFKKTGMSYDHPYLAGIRHHVITQAAPQADHAQGINPLAWNYAWRDMSKFLENNQVINRRLHTRAKIFVFELVGRALKINIKRKY